jgi:hypothetical protein
VERYTKLLEASAKTIEADSVVSSKARKMREERRIFTENHHGISAAPPT